MKLTSTLLAGKGNRLFNFNALSHASLVFLLWSVKRWKPQGVSPLEFSPFCNPLSLTPVAIRTLMTKSWDCPELYKISFLMQIEKVRITSPYRSSARWTESRNTIKPTHVERTRREIRKGDFKRGEPQEEGGAAHLLWISSFVRSGKAAALEEVSGQ